MKRIITIASAIILASPGAYFVFMFADRLNTFEKVSAIALPVLLGLAFFFISNWSMDRALHREREYLDIKIDNLVENFRSQRIKAYTTKKSVPLGGEFWNRLAEEARSRLFIIGSTNKSWFNKDQSQSRRLASQFERIARSGGEVTIVSLNRSSNVEMMRRFFSSYLHDELVEGADGISYRTVSALNYGAIMTDDKIVFMPLPHEDEFREETMVLEITAQEFPGIFQNYASDIERTAARATVQSV